MTWAQVSQTSQMAHEQKTAVNLFSYVTETMDIHKATATLLLRCCLNLKMSHLIVLGSSNKFWDSITMELQLACNSDVYASTSVIKVMCHHTQLETHIFNGWKCYNAPSLRSHCYNFLAFLSWKMCSFFSSKTPDSKLLVARKLFIQLRFKDCFLRMNAFW